MRVSSDGVHQRRRRVAAVALLALAAAIAWAIGSLGGSGGGGPEHSGFAARLARIGGSGDGSLRQRREAADAEAVKRTVSSMPKIVSGGRGAPLVALTFDDGPSEWTPRILEILEREGAPATFFTVGGMFSAFGSTASAVASAGYPLANHTWGHLQMPTLSPSDQASELDRASEAIKSAGGATPNLYRPPFGAVDDSSVKAANKRGMLVVLWDVDTLDWERPGADAIVANAVEGARPGSIILMHDGGGDRSETLAALPRIISGLRAKGFRLVTIPRLLDESPPQGEQTPPPVGQA